MNWKGCGKKCGVELSLDNLQLLCECRTVAIAQLLLFPAEMSTDFVSDTWRYQRSIPLSMQRRIQIFWVKTSGTVSALSYWCCDTHTHLAECWLMLWHAHTLGWMLTDAVTRTHTWLNADWCCDTHTHLAECWLMSLAAYLQYCIQKMWDLFVPCFLCIRQRQNTLWPLDCRNCCLVIFSLQPDMT
jgi:hypothetical protein